MRLFSIYKMDKTVALDAGIGTHIPAFSTVMACATSMVGVFAAADRLRTGGSSLALVGGSGVEPVGHRHDTVVLGDDGSEVLEVVQGYLGAEGQGFAPGTD